MRRGHCVAIELVTENEYNYIYNVVSVSRISRVLKIIRVKSQ